MPLSIVYYNGGTKGHMLAVAILSLYLLFIAGKKKEMAQVSLLYFICYETVINILEQDWIEMIIHSIVLLGYLFTLYILNRKKTLLFNQLFTVFILLELFVFSLFHSILSLEALTFSWIGIITLILSKYHKEGFSIE